MAATARASFSCLIRRSALRSFRNILTRKRAVASVRIEISWSGGCTNSTTQGSPRHFGSSNGNTTATHAKVCPRPTASPEINRSDDSAAAETPSESNPTGSAGSEPTSGGSSVQLLWHWLEQLQSPPNLITLSRIAATPVLSYWVVTHQTWPAIGGCCLAALSDAADGYLARHHNMATPLGTYLDPLADKLLINSLSVALWANGTLPTPLVSLWLARDVFLMTATYLYVAKNTARGLSVWDPTSVPIQVNPTGISKFNTAMQFLTLSVGIAHPAIVAAAATPDQAFLSFLAGPLLPALCWLTGATSVGSLASYLGHSAFTEIVRTERKQ